MAFLETLPPLDLALKIQFMKRQYVAFMPFGKIRIQGIGMHDMGRWHYFCSKTKVE